MAERKKKVEPEPVEVEAETPAAEVEVVNVIDQLLALEPAVRAAQRNLEDGPNVDAVRFQLGAVAHSINNLSDSIREVGHLVRP